MWDQLPEWLLGPIEAGVLIVVRGIVSDDRNSIGPRNQQLHGKEELMGSSQLSRATKLMASTI